MFTLQSVEAIKEAEKLMAKNNIISHKFFDINKQLFPFQDDALALYLMDYKNCIKV